MIDIDRHMHEYEGMVMGGCCVNDKTYKYDSVLYLLENSVFDKHKLINSKDILQKVPMISFNKIKVNIEDEDK